jgi:hypothetical protein
MRDTDVLLRQQWLLWRSAQLRGVLAADARALERPLTQVFATRNALAWLVQRPYLPLLGLAACVAVLRVRGTVLWVQRLGWLWQAYRQVARWLAIRKG